MQYDETRKLLQCIVISNAQCTLTLSSQQAFRSVNIVLQIL